MLEVGVVLGETYGIVRGDEGGRRRKDEVLGLRSDVGQQHRRIGRGDEGRVVMLARREHIHAGFFGLLRDRDGRLDPLVLGGGPAGGRISRDVTDGEHAELHGNS